MTIGAGLTQFDELLNGQSSSWNGPDDFSIFGEKDRGTFLGFNQGLKGINWVSQGPALGPDSPVSQITSTTGQNIAAAEPGFLSTAAGQQMLLKGGLMIAQMAFNAFNPKEKQEKPKPLPKETVERIRTEAHNKYLKSKAPKKKKEKKEKRRYYAK